MLGSRSAATRRRIACSCRSTSAPAISIARRASARCWRCSATPRRPIARRRSAPTSSAARSPTSCAARACCRRRCSARTPRRWRRCARRSTRSIGVPAVARRHAGVAVPDPGFKVCVVDAQRLFGVTADVFVAQQVPGGVVIVRICRKPTVIIEASFVELSRRRAPLPARPRVRAAARRLRAGDAPARGAARRGRRTCSISSIKPESRARAAGAGVRQGAAAQGGQGGRAAAGPARRARAIEGWFAALGAGRRSRRPARV